MTVIRPNSISGVTSITAQANEINVFKHDGVLAGLQLNGVNHHTSSGVSTFHTLNVLGNVSVGGTLTYQDVTNIDSVGLITARSGIDCNGTLEVSSTSNFDGAVQIADTILHLGDANTKIRFPAADTISFETAGSERVRITSGGQLNVGSNIKLGAAGIVTATAFVPTTQLSHRNILHNGEFKVIQRYGTSFTMNSSSDNEFTFDRWYVGTHDNLGDFTVSQEADAPAGFRTSVKIQSTSVDTSSSGSEQAFIQQTVEAQNVSHIFNGSGSQPMTLSFYYKSNATTTRQLWFYTPDTTRHYSAVFTPSATNTWEKITIPIPADTSNTVNDDNGPGFYVRFMIASGTVYKSSRPTSWSALSNDRYSGVTNLGTSTANNFYITGVQLEMGSVATPYEHRTMSEELVNCQRYYYPYKSILAVGGVGRPWIPVQMFLNDSTANDVFVVVAGLNEQRAKMRTGSAEVRVLAPLNATPITTYPAAGEWSYFYRGQGSGFKSGGGAFTWNAGYYNMYGCRSIAATRPTQIMIETNSEVGKVYVELDDEI